MYVCMYVCMYKGVCVCVCVVYVHLYVCIFIYTCVCLCVVDCVGIHHVPPTEALRVCAAQLDLLPNPEPSTQ